MWTIQELAEFEGAGNCFAEWTFLPGCNEAACRLLVEGGIEGTTLLEAAELAFQRTQAWANAIRQPVTLQTYGEQRWGVKTFLPQSAPADAPSSVAWAMEQGKHFCACCRKEAETSVVVTSVHDQGWQTTVYPSCLDHCDAAAAAVQREWRTEGAPIGEGLSVTVRRCR